MRKIGIISIFIVVSLLSCTRYKIRDNIIPTGRIKVKAVYQNKGIKDARIYVYQKLEKDFSLSIIAVSETSDDKGIVSLKLKPGMYYLMARKTNEQDVNVLKKNDYFGYLGGNPVKVSMGSSMELAINCVKNIFTPKELRSLDPNIDKPGISGAVYYDDKPLDRAEIFVYLSMENNMRGPAYFSAVSNKKGQFYAPLESGTYYLVCRKRNVSEPFGPILPGDFFGYSDVNPISLKQGEHKTVVIYALKKEAITNSSSVVTPSGMTGVDQTYISGKVYDLDKKPVSGVFVCLYKDDEMVGKPEYISNKTDKDGSFHIDLVSGGKFYMIAKENFGGIPKPNDFIGYLSESNDHSINIINNKDLTGLKMIGEKILSR